MNVRNRAALTQRANRESVTTVAIAVAEDDIACWTANRQTIITVVDHVVLEQYVRALSGETCQTRLISNVSPPWAIERTDRR